MNGIYTISDECFTRLEAKKIFKKIHTAGKIDLCVVSLDDDSMFAAWCCHGKNQAQFLPIFKAPDKQSQGCGAITHIYVIGEGDVFSADGKYFILYKGELNMIEMIHSSKLLYQIIDLLYDSEISEIRLCKIYPQCNDQTKEIVCWAWTNEYNKTFLHPVFVEDIAIVTDNGPEILGYPITQNGTIFSHDGILWEVRHNQNEVAITPYSV